MRTDAGQAVCKLRRRLRDRITEVCVEIDSRLGNKHGTAERGCYFWYWPPEPNIGVEVLVALHRDAVAMLDSIVTT